MAQKLIFTNLVIEAVDSLVADLGSPRVFVLVDMNTAHFVLPILKSQCKSFADATVITTLAGDSNKNVDSLQKIWKELSQGEATRNSVIINLGGGMVTDLGGFAAATFKRGIRFVNIPTTLLGAVDAAVGGKTGINFNGLKNEIGAFSEAEAVIISTLFFNTLPQQQLLSGYAEMLKHGLLDSDKTLADLLRYDIVTESAGSSDRLLRLIEESVNIKKNTVESDPTEKGLRRTLNLGHTIGHAFESFAMAHQSPVPHGYAVAWGLVVELILSRLKMDFPAETMPQFAAYVKENYGKFPLQCKDYPELIALMRHDKKNAVASEINFTLLSAVGSPHIDCTATEKEIIAALDLYQYI